MRGVRTDPLPVMSLAQQRLTVALDCAVLVTVLVPVVLGMVVRQRATAFADRMDKPVRIASAVVLALVIIGTIVAERENITIEWDLGLPEGVEI